MESSGQVLAKYIYWLGIGKGFLNVRALQKVPIGPGLAKAANKWSKTKGSYQSRLGRKKLVLQGWQKIPCWPVISKCT